MGVTIRELSERSGVKVPTIRYYERQGLLPEPVRTGTGQRRYGSVDVARLRFVRFGRGLGLEVGEIRSLIELVGEGNGEEIVVLAETVADRAERMQVLCVSLRSISTAIIAGAIDEAGAFNRLIGGEGTVVEEAAEAPLALDPGAPEAPQGQGGPPREASETKEPVSAAHESASEGVSGTEVATEGDAPETPLPKPKRKRARARS